MDLQSRSALDTYQFDLVTLLPASLAAALISEG